MKRALDGLASGLALALLVGAWTVAYVGVAPPDRPIHHHVIALQVRP